MELPRLTCKRCGHTWVPRKWPVYACPNKHCHSPQWNVDRESK